MRTLLPAILMVIPVAAQELDARKQIFAFLITGKFVVSTLAMMLLLFMTDFVKVSLATDNARGSQKPETWDIGREVRLGIVLGVAMIVEVLGLLAIGWRYFDLGPTSPVLPTFTFQILLYFALFSLVCIRERRHFWASWPQQDASAGPCLRIRGGNRPLQRGHPRAHAHSRQGDSDVPGLRLCFLALGKRCAQGCLDW